MKRSDELFYYGMGERHSPLQLNERHVRLACVDAMGYNAQASDPLYKHLAYYIAFNKKTRHVTSR